MKRNTDERGTLNHDKERGNADLRPWMAGHENGQ